MQSNSLIKFAINCFLSPNTHRHFQVDPFIACRELKNYFRLYETWLKKMGNKNQRFTGKRSL